MPKQIINPQEIVDAVSNLEPDSLSDFDNLLFYASTLGGEKKKSFILRVINESELMQELLDNPVKYRMHIAFVLSYINFFDLSEVLQKTLIELFEIEVLPHIKSIPRIGKNRKLGSNCSGMERYYSEIFNFNLNYYSSPDSENKTNVFSYQFFCDLENYITGKAEEIVCFLCTQSFLTEEGDVFLFGINYNITGDNGFTAALNYLNKKLTSILPTIKRILDFLRYHSSEIEDCKLSEESTYYLLYSLYDNLGDLVGKLRTDDLSKKKREKLSKYKKEIRDLVEMYSRESFNKEDRDPEKLFNFLNELIEFLLRISKTIEVNLQKNKNFSFRIDLDNFEIIFSKIPDKVEWRVSRAIEFENSGTLSFDLNTGSSIRTKPQTPLINMRKALKIFPDLFEES